ncbi:MAG: DNA polymerase III subunit delta', partial [Pseudomonadota bacterium]
AARSAQLLLCEGRGEGTQPCEKCDACRWFAAGNHPDVRFVEPEALSRHAAESEDGEGEAAAEKKRPSLQIRIEQTRALADFVNLASHRGGHRVAIIHPAEDMNIATANSLLKSLEEPPSGAVFLLVSHRPARLLPTIRSRCVPVPVPLPEPGAAAAWLEARGVRDAARWLAFAGGAPLRALEYASGERGAAVERVLRGLAAGERDALWAGVEREDLEPLAEVLQKIALDRAFVALAACPKYALSGGAAPKGGARAWLAYARAMGRHRALAGHPLNPRLAAAEMLSAMPDLE